MLAAATCHRGTADVLELELNELIKAAPKAKTQDYIIFPAASVGDLAGFAYLARSPGAVMMHLADFAFKSLDELEQKLKAIPKPAIAQHLRDHKFRVSCTRGGEHDFNSKDVEEIFGEMLHTAFPDNKVSLKGYEIDFCIHIFGSSALVGISVAGFPLDKRSMHVMRTQDELNGAVAYSLLRLSGYNGKGTLLDPFMGSGNIIIEAALYSIGRSVHFYSKDAFAVSRFHAFDFAGLDTQDPKPIKSPPLIAFDPLLKNLRSAQKNAKLAGVAKQIRFGRSDLDWLDTKFGKAELDFMVTSPPYESQIRSKKDIEKLYGELFHQAEYILKPKGILALITPKPDTLKECMKHFVLKSEHGLWQGRKMLVVLVMQKD